MDVNDYEYFRKDIGGHEWATIYHDPNREFPIDTFKCICCGIEAIGTINPIHLKAIGHSRVRLENCAEMRNLPILKRAKKLKRKKQRKQ